jgi:hypothetical protein
VTETAASLRDTRPFYTRPRIVFSMVAGSMLALALLAPEPSAGRTGDPRPTTYSTRPLGARLFYDLVHKLGWRVARRDSAEIFSDERTIHAVLAASRPVRPVEAHALLEHARNGGALFIVLADGRDVFADSLRIGFRSTGASPMIEPVDTADCGSHPPPRFPMLWPGNLSYIYRLQWRRQIPDSLQVFLRVSNTAAAVPIRPGARPRPLGSEVPPPSSTARPDSPADALVGFPFGRGRIVIGSDPDLIRNDALRVCQYGLDVPVARALEYLRDGGTRPRDLVVVDEFHHGFGSQPGAFGAVVRYLGATPSGRLFAQLLAARGSSSDARRSSTWMRSRARTNA